VFPNLLHRVYETWVQGYLVWLGCSAHVHHLLGAALGGLLERWLPFRLYRAARQPAWLAGCRAVARPQRACA
jgi:hypothetical protein